MATNATIGRCSLMKIIVAALLVLSSTAAMAQKEPLTPAPVPGRILDTYAPSDRAGRSDAADNSAPFSAAPSGLVVGNGQSTAQPLPSSQRDDPATPSLSR